MPPTSRHLPARLAVGPALRLQSDRRLVGLVREGHESAFEEIVRRYRRPLDRFAASIVGSHAADVTQDSFGKALVALRHAEADVELRPWLFRIVRNTALNDLRDRPPAAAELAEELVAGGRSAAAEAEQRAEIGALVTHLQALPENQRAALVMRELEGMSHEEIAAALGISDGAARQAIARARAAVRAGFGALVPLPLLRALSGEGDRVAAGLGGGAAVAGGAGAGALKVGLATVVVAGTLGAGVAIEHHGGGHGSDRTTEVASAPSSTQGADRREPAPLPRPPGRIGRGDGTSSPDHREVAAGGTPRHRAGHAGVHVGGPRAVPVAQPTTVTVTETDVRSEAGGRPGSSRDGGGQGGSDSGGEGAQGRGGGHRGSPDSGGEEHEGSRGNDGGGSVDESGHESPDGSDRTSGAQGGGGESDGSGDGSRSEPARTTSVDDGGSDGVDPSGSGSGDTSGTESTVPIEAGAPTVGETVPPDDLEPSP